MAANTFGRQVILPLTNSSGGGVIAGDVVVLNTAANDSFTTTTSAATTTIVGIAQETIANAAIGRVLVQGYAALVNVNASVTRGNFGATHTVAKQAADVGASRAAGSFCFFLTGGTTPDAYIFPTDLGGGTGAPTNADYLVGTASGSLSAEIVVGTTPGGELGGTWASPTAEPGCYENFLTANVTVVNADTFYNGPAVTPAAGTYLVIASLVMTSSFAGVTGCTLQIWDGTNAYANGQDYVSSAGAVITITRFARVTVTGAETITARGSSVRGGSVVTILDTTSLTGATADKASSIVAMRITSL